MLAVVAAILLFAIVLPSVQYRRAITAINNLLATDPEGALRRIEELQKKKDNAEIRELKDRAQLSSKNVRSQTYLREAERLAQAGDFESAFQQISRAKQNVFRGTTVTQEFSQKENELKLRAAAHYRDLARAESDLGEKYFFYTLAIDYAPRDGAIQMR